MTSTKWGRDVAVGDVIEFLGDFHMVRSLSPGTHLIEGARTAHAEAGWAITLDPCQAYPVVTL